MSILPNNGYDITQFSKPQVSTSYTWKLDPNKERVAGFVDELDSVEQACYMMLRTELGKYEIYPDWYGMELNDLYGKPRGYIEAVLPNRIEECLMVDRRISSVGNTSLYFEGSMCVCRFTVNTIFGNIDMDISYELEN